MRISLTHQEHLQVKMALLRQTPDGLKAHSLDRLMLAWATFVSRVEKGYADSVYEYTNDLTVRDILETVICDTGDHTGEKICEAIREWDQRFELATKPVHAPLRIRDENAYSWWWRVPKVLPVELRTDLENEGFL